MIHIFEELSSPNNDVAWKYNPTPAIFHMLISWWRVSLGFLGNNIRILVFPNYKNVWGFPSFECYYPAFIAYMRSTQNHTSFEKI